MLGGNGMERLKTTAELLATTPASLTTSSNFPNSMLHVLL